MRFLPSPRETLRKLMVIAVLVEVSRYPIRPLALHRIIMPSASLIPDRQLTFSPELAEIIGLEEAVLLQELGAQLTDRDEWTSLSLESLPLLQSEAGSSLYFLPPGCLDAPKSKTRSWATSTTACASAMVTAMPVCTRRQPDDVSTKSGSAAEAAR
ncbi:MAG: hypothetical protein CMP83_06650 [Gammaproteobacteria bacterium]|nr:hypothetical protein [Gammaproteobacteria bacterium]